MSSVLCIASMHRSGSSLIGSWLQACGMTLDHGNMVGSGPGNELGHFEDHDFLDLHRSVILKRFSRSRGWIVSRAIPPEGLVCSRERALDLVTARNASLSNWGWKDPRSSLFLHFWKSVIPNLKVILLWRPHQEVIMSLLERSKSTAQTDYHISCLQACRCWKTYNTAILDYRMRYPSDTILMRTTDVISHDTSFIEHLNATFGLSLDSVAITSVFKEKHFRQRKYSIMAKSICGMQFTFRPEL